MRRTSVFIQEACEAADADGFVSKSRIHAELFSEIERVFGKCRQNY